MVTTWTASGDITYLFFMQLNKVGPLVRLETWTAPDAVIMSVHSAVTSGSEVLTTAHRSRSAGKCRQLGVIAPGMNLSYGESEEWGVSLVQSELMNLYSYYATDKYGRQTETREGSFFKRCENNKYTTVYCCNHWAWGAATLPRTS